MVRVLILSLFLSLFNLSAQAFKINYASAVQRLVVSEVEIGQEVTVTQADLAELYNDISNDPDNIDGGIFVRVFLVDADRKLIESEIKNAKSEAEDFSDPLIIIEKNPDTNASYTEIKYAQVDKTHPISSSLYYHEADSIQSFSDYDRYKFSIRNFDEIQRNSIVVFQFDIYNIYNFEGDLSFTIKLENLNSSNTGSTGGDNSGGDNGSGGDSSGGDSSGGGTTSGSGSAISSSLIAFSDRSNNVQEALNRNYICQDISNGSNVQEICDTIQLEILSTELSTRIAELKTNKNFLESLSSTIRQQRKNRIITKIQNRSLQIQIRKALTVNKDAVKRTKAFKALIDKRRLKPKTFEKTKAQNALQKLKISAQTKVNRVDSLVSAQIASDLLELGLIDQATFSSL